MSRNVQTTSGINLRPSLVKAPTQHNFLTAPQTKNRNNFFSAPLLKKSISISIFLSLFILFLEDAFEIEEFYIHAGSGDESPTQYIASADIIEDVLTALHSITLCLNQEYYSFSS